MNDIRGFGFIFLSLKSTIKNQNEISRHQFPFVCFVHIM